MKIAPGSTLLAALMISLNATAAPIEVVDARAQSTVHFADLDLTRAAGVERLYLRIRSAAEDVCEQPNARGASATVIARKCVKQAIARAVADVNAPTLTSYYLAKTRHAVTVAKR